MATEELPKFSELVAEEVRELMARRRVSGTGLAPVLRLSAESTARRVRGEQPFNVDELWRIASFFEVPVAALLPSAERLARGVRG